MLQGLQWPCVLVYGDKDRILEAEFGCLDLAVATPYSLALTPRYQDTTGPLGCDGQLLTTSQLFIKPKQHTKVQKNT